MTLRDKIVYVLRKPRFTSTDYDRVGESVFQWGRGMFDEFPDGKYTLSILGIINGPLTKVNLVMVINHPDNTFSIRKKWW